MADDKKVEFEVTAKADGVEAGLNQAARAAKDAFSTMGDSAKSAAENISQSMKEMQAALQMAQTLMAGASEKQRAALEKTVASLEAQIKSTETAIQGSTRFAVVQEQTGSKTAAAAETLKQFIEGLHGLDRTVTGAASSARVFQEHMATLGLSTEEMRRRAQSAREEVERLNQVFAVQGEGFRGVVDRMLGVGQGFKSARDSAAAFEEQLGPIGARVQTMSGTQLRGLVDELNGVGRTFLSAKTSAEAFGPPLETGTRVVSLYGIGLREMVDRLNGVGEGHKSAKDSARAFEEQMGPVGTQVRTVTSSALRPLIDELNGVGRAFLSAEKAAESFKNEATKAVPNGVRYSLNGSLQEFINTSTGVKTGFSSAKDAASAFVQSAEAAAEGAKTVGDQMRQGGMHTAGMTREIIVLAREMMHGEWSRVPGSIMVLGERMGNAAIKTMAFVGALGAMITAGVEAYHVLERLARAKLMAQAGAVLGGLDPKDADRWRQTLVNLNHVTSEEAGKIVNELARTVGMTGPVMDELVQQVKPLSIAMGADMVSAAGQIASAFASPTTQGRSFLQTLRASTDTVKAFDRALMDNDVLAQRRIMLEQLSSSMIKVRDIDTKRVVGHEFGYGDDRFKRMRELQQTLDVAKKDLADKQMLEAKGLRSGSAAQAAIVSRLERELAEEKAKQADVDKTRLAGAVGSLTSEQADTKAGGLEGWGQQMRTQLTEMTDKVVLAGGKWKDVHTEMLRVTVKFWEDVSKREGLSRTQRITAEKERMTAQQALDIATLKTGEANAKTGYDAQIAALSAEQAARRDDHAEVLRLQEQKLTIAKARYGEQSKEYQNMLREMENLRRQFRDRETASDLETFKSNQRIMTSQAREYAAMLAQQVSQFNITHAERMAMIDRFEQEQGAIQLRTLDDMIAKLDQGTEAWKKAMAAREELVAKLQASHATAMAGVTAADERANRNIVQGAYNAASSVWTSFSSSLGQIMSYQTTWGQVAANTFRRVAQMAVDMAGELLARWSATMLAKTALTQTSAAASIAAQQAEGSSGWGAIIQWVLRSLGIITSTETAKTAAVTAGVTARTAAVTAGQAAGGPAEYAMAVGDIGASAARAGAAAFASTAAIPVVGPGMAPEAAAAAYAATIAFTAAVPPFAQGTMNVPRDMIAQIHKGETIVPRTFAEQLRDGKMSFGNQNTSSSSSSVSVSYSPTINSNGTDPMTQLSKVLRASRRELVSYLWDTTRNGGLVLPGRAVP